SAPVAADRLQRAPLASPGIAARGALPADAEVGEGEVEPHRIDRVELAQAGGDILRGLPGQILARRETDEAADAVDVRIEGNDERVRRDVPETEVDAVGPAHHPAQIQVEALAGAASRRVRQQMLEAPRGALLPEDGSEVRRAQLVHERGE